MILAPTQNRQAVLGVASNDSLEVLGEDGLTFLLAVSLLPLFHPICVRSIVDIQELLQRFLK